MVFSPNTFRGAPHTVLATLALAPGATAADEAALLKAAAAAYPTVTSVRVKDALQAIDNVVSQLAIAIQGASSVALFASLLVLAGALAAGHRARLYDAVVLKTLGATRWRLLAAYAPGIWRPWRGNGGFRHRGGRVGRHAGGHPRHESAIYHLVGRAARGRRAWRCWSRWGLAFWAPGASWGRNRPLTYEIFRIAALSAPLWEIAPSLILCGCVGCPAPRGNQRGFHVRLESRSCWRRYGRARTTAAEVDQGLRAFMLGVYNHMTTGLAISGLVALALNQLATADSSTGAVARAGNVYLTQFGYYLYATPLKWVLILAPLAFIFIAGSRMMTMSPGAARATFWAFAAVMGASLSTIFLVYTSASIVRVFFITAAAFGALSLYGYTTKKSLSGWGSFLMMGVVASSSPAW